MGTESSGSEMDTYFEGLTCGTLLCMRGLLCHRWAAHQLVWSYLGCLVVEASSHAECMIVPIFSSQMVNLQESKYHDACWREICVHRLWITNTLAQLNIGVQYWLFTFYWQNPHEVYYANSFQTYWPQLWIVLCIKISCGYPHFDFLSLHIVLGMPIHLSITTVFTTINSTNSSHRSFQ